MSNTKIVISKPGSLSKFGYHVADLQSDRRLALEKSVKSKSVGYQKTMQRLNALFVFNKNKNAFVEFRVGKDKNWLKKMFGNN